MASLEKTVIRCDLLEMTVVRCGKSTYAWVLCVSRVSIISVHPFGISADPTPKSAPPLSILGSLRGVVSTRPSVCARELVCKAFGDTKTWISHMLAASAPLPFNCFKINNCCIKNTGTRDRLGCWCQSLPVPGLLFISHSHHAFRTHHFSMPFSPSSAGG